MSQKSLTYCVRKNGTLSTLRHTGFTSFFILPNLLGFFCTAGKLELGSTFLYLEGLYPELDSKGGERAITLKARAGGGAESGGILLLSFTRKPEGWWLAVTEKLSEKNVLIPFPCCYVN